MLSDEQREISVHRSTSRESTSCLPTKQNGISNPGHREKQFVSPGRQPVFPTALSQVGSRQENQLNGLAMPVRYDHLVRKICVQIGTSWAGAV